MRIQHLKWTAGFLIASLCSAQTPVVASAPASTPALQPAAPIVATPAATPSPLVVPAGTVIPLTLDRPILRKSRVGDSVNATVGFPVTLGSQFAIPAGTDVLGVITALSKKKKPSVSIHFTRMTYPNGYTVIFDAVNTAALTLPVIVPDASSETTYADASFGRPRAFGPNPAADPQQQPPPTEQDPFHGKLTPGEKKAIVIFAPLTLAILIFLLIRSSVKSTQLPILFDAGWQFQMTTQSAFTVDTAQFTGAAAAVSH